ncbi:MAG: HIT family hydrolase [Betaproteobacteria bacterium RIFCSPLOWO2_02_FULL_63_19]|nr:MAG: HIT family hydrolase [Betaproteobacteria bacterium RIFCSPLOWO2_02_FULL_63_19]
MTKLTAQGCELCNPDSEQILWQDGFCRVVLLDEPGYPGLCRVILEQHISEMSDLSAPERARLMDAVFATEAALRAVLVPDKINLASLGNAVAHLHWHVIPRYRDDPHFPRPIWAEPCRSASAIHGTPDIERLARSLYQHLSRYSLAT